MDLIFEVLARNLETLYSDSMEYRKLGNTDIKVSKICLGSMTWGGQNTEQDAHDQLNFAIDRGINFIDTAEMYSVPPSAKTYGLTEKYIGSYLKKYPEKREALIIATKIAGPGVDYIRGGGGFSPPASIEEAVQGSLRRLQIEYIDLYQLHWTQRMTPRFGTMDYHRNWLKQDDRLAETLGTLGQLKAKGLIREVGLSNEHPWGVMHCLKLHARDSQIPRIQSVQNVYNLVSRIVDIGLSEVLIREKVSLLPYSPLAGGLLSGKYQNGKRPEGARFSTWGMDRMTRYLNSKTDKAVSDYATLAGNHELSPAQMALSFVNDRVFVTSNIIGATTMRQLEECISSEGRSLGQEILRSIESVHHGNPNPAV